MVVPEVQLKQLVKQLDYYDSDLLVNSALIGSDFLATTVRAWPQFFFGYVLPFPLIQAASFGLAGVLWTDRSNDVRTEAVLTDEFILAYLALKDQEDQLSKEEQSKLQKIADAIKKIEYKNDEARERIKKLNDFVGFEANKQKILTALNTQKPSEALTSQDQWSKRWAYGFNIAFQYATAHWVLWMTGTLLLYSKDRWEFDNWHGVNDDYHADVNNNPGNIPSVLESDIYASLQFILPALIVLGAQAYKWYYKAEQKKQDDFTKQLELVRAEYLYDEQELEKQKKAQESAQASAGSSLSINTTANTENPANETSFFNSERWATILSMGTAFWTAFLVGNLMAWPITGGLNRILAETKHDKDYQMDDEIKIFTSFSIIMLGCFAHMYYKYVDMQKELRDAGMMGVTPKTTYAPTQSIWDYYRDNKRTAMNIVLDRMSGSGGILAMRFIFMGGVGGYAWDKNDSGGMDHIKEVLPIAVTAMVLMIVLNIYQTYYAAQRGNVLKENHDAGLVLEKGKRLLTA